jgi:Holliday junction DNA helicase RuvA
MIGFIEGRVRAVRPGHLIVEAGGVGYRVAAERDTLFRAREGSTIALWVHTVVREEALDLYGFMEEEALRFFELLLTVSGIGPRSALAVLDVAAIETLRSAIREGNAGYLTTVSGVGKKTAEKIVLELRDKVGEAAEGTGAALRGDADALEAMRSLGYSAPEARDALRKVPASISASNDRLREALRLLGSR